MSRAQVVFGPVPSRRLGRSLGIDLMPYKTCSYDCTYCQLGRTTDLTVTRREYVPVSRVLDEARAAFARGITADYVTLSGSGEPTLHSGLAEIIAGLKRLTDIPVAVLTNGSLLWQSAVRDALMGADLVVPSLDCGDAAAFARVNRPHPSLEFDAMVAGLREFSHAYRGRLWLEVLLLAEETGTAEHTANIAALAQTLRVDRVQLNTVERPPCESAARPVPEQQLQELARLFTVPVEVIPAPRAAGADGTLTADDSALLALLARRPCTVDDICVGLGLHPHTALKQVTALLAGGLVREERRAEKRYFRAVTPGEENTDGTGR
jgi:wyosine [tRNA(Phe)-imidazoG37] synthetase (radical SAM superfamily)